MIRLSRKTYTLYNITESKFWDKLDKITVGQNINPEISYSTPFYGNFDNVFGGRRVKNKFSIFLYRPITRGFRTEILAKGKLKYDESDNMIILDINFELPFWSILMIIILGAIFISPFYFLSIIAGIIINLIFLLIFGLIVNSNLFDVKLELDKQLNMMRA